MKRWTKRLLVLAMPLGLAGMALASTFTACPVPEPPAFEGELPAASPPVGMALFQLPTGVTHRSAAFAYRGGSFSDKRDFSMTAVLIKHPKGDVLIDTGLGSAIDSQIPLMPFWFRAMTSFTRSQSAREQLDVAGYDITKLRGLLLTHAHWDHASGIPEFPDVPVLVTEDERTFIDQGGWITSIARSFTGVRYETYAFDGAPYLGFSKSHDLYGDGSIVIVPAAGHTPGSVIVLVALPGDARYAFLGDLVWQREGITERQERPAIQRSLADSDPEAVRELILGVAAISRRFPEMTLVPAHDQRGFASIPRL
jgi:glyoxylase-like metal-dependent hydrolase (beta-lactamase superfamily II)